MRPLAELQQGTGRYHYGQNTEQGMSKCLLVIVATTNRAFYFDERIDPMRT